MEEKYLTALQLAEYLDLSRSRIADLKASGDLAPDSKRVAPGKGGGSLYEKDKNRILYIKYLREVNEIGRAHVWTPVTDVSRMPSSAWKKKEKKEKKKKKKIKKKKKRNIIKRKRPKIMRHTLTDIVVILNKSRARYDKRNQTLT